MPHNEGNKNNTWLQVENYFVYKGYFQFQLPYLTKIITNTKNRECIHATVDANILLKYKINFLYRVMSIRVEETRACQLSYDPWPRACLIQSWMRLLRKLSWKLANSYTDLYTLIPWDWQTVEEALMKTHACQLSQLLPLGLVWSNHESWGSEALVKTHACQVLCDSLWQELTLMQSFACQLLPTFILWNRPTNIFQWVMQL